MKFDTYNYCVGRSFVCAIEYGDESGLSDEESRQLSEFLETLPRGAGHWSWGEHEEFARCDISDMHGDCTRAEYLVPYSREGVYCENKMPGQARKRKADYLYGLRSPRRAG